MNFKNRLVLVSIFALSLVFGLMGCGAADTTKTNTTTNTTTNKTTTADNKSTTTTNTTTTTTEDSVGVAECDEYIKKYEACVNSKVPEASRAALKTAFEQQRKGFKDAAANPSSKASLASSCKTMLETAKSSMSAYGCEW
jgi:hypothetical protein